MKIKFQNLTIRSNRTKNQYQKQRCTTSNDRTQQTK